MTKHSAQYLICLCIVQVSLARYPRPSTEEPEAWTGRWLPERLTVRPKTQTEDNAMKQLTNGRIPMGIKNDKCDDAKTNLTLDWNGSPFDHICMSPRSRYIPDYDVSAIIEFENIPKAYLAPHYCMDQELQYDTAIPTFGAHRPLWPRYGEYKFVPKQRWLHSLEHGGIVALYNPCADLSEIRLFKKIVKGCLRRHVITPYVGLSRKRPLALVAWGVRLFLPFVDADVIREFIQDNALRGPEKVSQDGQYDFMLITPASVVSDKNDRQLCPAPLAHD